MENNESNEKIDIVFVILHYLVESVTRKSIQFIKENIDTRKYHVIIVDNASPNNSGEKIKEMYKKDNNITVLINKENLGFAKGNNIGFQYAKEKLKPQFIVLMNNDVFILDKQFFTKTLKIYEECNFAVMGPKICTPSGNENINPFGIAHIPDDIYMKDLLKEFKKRLFLETYYLKRGYCLFHKILNHTLYKVINPPKIKELSEDLNQNVVLHGSVLVFSEIYMNRFDGLDNRTFFYMEEQLLHLHMYFHNLKMVYCKEIRVHHEEEASTKEAIKSNRKNEIFCFSNRINSIAVWLDTYQEYILGKRTKELG